MTKETFVYGYAPLSVIQDVFQRTYAYPHKEEPVGKGVVLYGRLDVLAWALQQPQLRLLIETCEVAAEEGRIDLLDEVWNNVNDEDYKREILEYVDYSAAGRGKLNVLKWLETHQLDIYKKRCAKGAAKHGHLHILQWLKEEKGLKLFERLYEYAIRGGGHFHILRWLRKKQVSWTEYTFYHAAERGNLDILQWLHDEGCPWPDDDAYRVDEDRLKPGVVEWFNANGYDNVMYK